MKRLLILGGPVFQKRVVEKAHEMGLYVGLMDINDDAPAAELADEFFVGSILDKAAALEVAHEFKPDAIMSGACDTSVRTVAWLCAKLGLPGNSEECAYRATDKVAMLEAFAHSGVSHPAFEVVPKNSLEGYDTSLEYPVIVKPTDSAGGRGINLVESEDKLIPALLSSSRAGRSGDILVEECMHGPEVSVEVLVVDGAPHVLQITDKITSGAPHFYEVGHVQPSSLPSASKEAIASLASRAVLSVGVDNGPAHVEIMLTADGPKMVELGARLGGDCITSYLIDGSITGIDMTKAAIKLALGERLQSLSYSNSGRFFAVKFIPSSKGTIKSIDGIDEARKTAGVIHVESTGVAGKDYKAAVDDSSRFAFVVASGDNREDALSCCDGAIEKISIDVR